MMATWSTMQHSQMQHKFRVGKISGVRRQQLFIQIYKCTHIGSTSSAQAARSFAKFHKLDKLQQSAQDHVHSRSAAQPVRACGLEPPLWSCWSKLHEVARNPFWWKQMRISFRCGVAEAVKLEAHVRYDFWNETKRDSMDAQMRQCCKQYPAYFIAAAPLHPCPPKDEHLISCPNTP